MRQALSFHEAREPDVLVGLSFARWLVMRIEIIDEDESASAQARTYAEYRLFATLARHAAGIRSVRVVLGERRKGAAGRTTCFVNVVLEPSGSLVVRAHGLHLHGAIDRAAERMGDLIKRRARQAIDSSQVPLSGS